MSGQNESPGKGNHGSALEHRRSSVPTKSSPPTPPVNAQFEIPDDDSSDHSEPEDSGVFSQQLVAIEEEANSLLERLSDEFEEIRSYISEKADQDLRNAQLATERYQTHAMDQLEKEYIKKRDAINSAAQKQIQFTYSLAQAERHRPSSSPRRSFVQPIKFNRFFYPPIPGTTVPNLQAKLGPTFNQKPYRPETPKESVLIFDAGIKFPLIYNKPFQVPAMTAVPVLEMPTTLNMTQ